MDESQCRSGEPEPVSHVKSNLDRLLSCRLTSILLRRLRGEKVRWLLSGTNARDRVVEPLTRSCATVAFYVFFFVRPLLHLLVSACQGRDEHAMLTSFTDAAYSECSFWIFAARKFSPKSTSQAHTTWGRYVNLTKNTSLTSDRHRSEIVINFLFARSI